MEYFGKKELTPEKLPTRRERFLDRLSKKRILGFGALIATGIAMITTDNNPEILQYSASFAENTVEFNPFIVATAATASILGLNTAQNQFNDYDELLSSTDDQGLYANPDIAVQEETKEIIRSERFRKVGALVISTIAAGAFLMGASNLKIIHESSNIDSIGIVIVTDENSRTKDIKQEDNREITRLKASVDGGIQIGNELNGVNTTYITASGGQSGVEVIGQSDGSKEQDQAIVDGYERFTGDMVFSYPAATVESVDTALNLANQFNPGHKIVVGDFGASTRTPNFVGEEAGGVRNISLVSFGDAKNASQAIGLVGEEDVYSARSTDDVQRIINEIIDDNSLTTIQETNLSDKFYKLAILSSLTLVVSIIASGIGIKIPKIPRRKKLIGE